MMEVPTRAVGARDVQVFDPLPAGARPMASITRSDSADRHVGSGLPSGKDTVFVPATNCTGMTMLHCRILEHDESGVIGIWHLVDGR
jgi:hypothetical protein